MILHIRCHPVRDFFVAMPAAIYNVNEDREDSPSNYYKITNPISMQNRIQ